MLFESIVEAPLREMALSTLRSKDVESIRVFTNTHLDVQYSSTFFLQFLVTRGCVCLQLLSEGRILGVISGRLSFDTTFSEDSSTLEGDIYTLAVEPEVRRLGLGARLVDEMIQRMASIAEYAGKRLGSVRLDVKAADAPAHQFYRKLGFQPVGTKPKYYGPLGDAISMTKYLL
ncbi:hypothetical protein TRVA0_015S00804 [Trichomonascus vanleenenianus]|uniref:GNAT family N-acetyltransferase n=1 Tax=Trichomonascus vanleenenianus TaxID=2268995 RepID=UPI003EC97F66